MRKIARALTNSAFVQLLIALAAYALYAAVLGICLFPTALLLVFSFQNWMGPVAEGSIPSFANIFFFSLSIGVGIYVYLLFGIIVMGLLIRFLSLGMKPGRYPAVSLTTLRWLVYSGIYTLAHRTILPLIPMSPFLNLFFRIIGCKMGKNVKLNTWTLNDAYLIELGDNVIVGGETDLSCHLFEHNKLILKKIVVESDSLIGAHCYISPGVHVGKRCLIGLYSFIRQDTVVPDGSKITALAGLPMRQMYKIEKQF